MLELLVVILPNLLHLNCINVHYFFDKSHTHKNCKYIDLLKFQIY